MMKLIYFFLPVFILQGCKAQEKLPSASNKNTLLWEISGNGLKEVSYLFGTFHIMCKKDIQISNNLKKAMAQSGEVYFEMDLDDATNTMGAVFFMNMRDDVTLKDLYTAEEYIRLKTYFDDILGMPLTMLQKMKPYFIEALLYPKMMPCKTLSGVEEVLMAMAKQSKKEIRGFEDIAFQASVFDSIPYKEQAKDLLKTIDSIGDFKKELDTLLEVYTSQRLDKMEALFSKSGFGMKTNRDVLLDNRNKNWVNQLKNIMPARSVFIAVGAGHLVGENGLIALLKREGYTLRPVQNKD